MRVLLTDNLDLFRIPNSDPPQPLTLRERTADGRTAEEHRGSVIGRFQEELMNKAKEKFRGKSNGTATEIISD